MIRDVDLDSILRGARDATGRFTGSLDVGIVGAEIVAIEPAGTLGAARSIVDCGGLLLFPGFVSLSVDAPRDEEARARGEILLHCGVIACGVLDREDETTDLPRLGATIPQRIARIAALPRADRFDELTSGATPTALRAFEGSSGRADALAIPELEASIQVAMRRGFRVIVCASEERDGARVAPRIEIAATTRWIERAREVGVSLHFERVISAFSLETIAEAKGEGIDVTCGVDLRDLLVAVPAKHSLASIDRTRAIEGLRDGRVDTLTFDRRVGAPVGWTEMLDWVRRGELDASALSRATAIRPAELLGFGVAPTLELGRRAELLVVDPAAHVPLRTIVLGSAIVSR